MKARADWRDNAACREIDLDLFFPLGTSERELIRVAEAKRVCRACPVQAQCLAWALDHYVTDGIWGGITADERRAIREIVIKNVISQGNTGGISQLDIASGQVVDNPAAASSSYRISRHRKRESTRRNTNV
jgi:WhiB family transcriptional regulator, redox-sensing transcriptional regulator